MGLTIFLSGLFFLSYADDLIDITPSKGMTMRYLVAALFLFGMIGCTKSTAICDLGKTASSLMTKQIVTQFGCSNEAAINADMEKSLVEFKVCEAKKATSDVGMMAIKIGDVICKPVVDALAGSMIGQIPPAWGCKGGPITDDAKAKLLAACSKAF